MLVVSPQRQEELKEWLCERFGGVDSSTPVYYIGKEIKGKVVAVAAFNNYSKRTLAIHIAGEGKGVWFTRDFRRYIFWYPFGYLGVNRLIAPIEIDNLKCLRFAKHLGFQEAFIKNKTNILSMTKNQCRWLKET